ncbi:MAG: ATP-binding protein [Burkholderiaceae bacterium]
MTHAASLQGRLLRWVLGVAVAVWLASAALTWRDAQHELDELLDGHLAQAAALLVAQQARELDDDDHGIDAPSLHHYAPRVTFQVWHERRLMLRSSNAPLQPMAPLDSAHRKGLHTLNIDGDAWRVFAANGAEADVQVFVGERLGARRSILRAVLRSLAWPMAAALPLLALGIWWAVRRGTAPLRTLGATLAAREPRALDAVTLPDAPAEMQPMLAALNGLFGRIDTLMASERRFTADAAHELRTPVAAIRAQAQVALGAADSAERAHALRATIEGCDRASRLIEQLLLLARLEGDAAPAAMQRVDLAATAQQVVAALAPAALARGQQLELDAPQPCRVLGQEPLLAALVRNLADNALRYSPPGARVQVGVREASGQVTLSVDDSGPGLTEAEQARLGERFFRALGTEASGSGLGWSIVRRIAQMHQGTLAVSRSAALGGLAVRFTLPAAPAG